MKLKNYYSKKETYVSPDATDLQIMNCVCASSAQVQGDNIDDWAEGNNEWFN